MSGPLGPSSFRNLWVCCIDSWPFGGLCFCSSAFISSLLTLWFFVGFYSWEKTRNPKWFWNLHWGLLGTVQVSVSVSWWKSDVWRVCMWMSHMAQLHFRLINLDLLRQPLIFGFNSSSAEQSQTLTMEEQKSHFLCSSNQPAPKSPRSNISEITNANNWTFSFQIYIFQNALLFSLALSERLISFFEVSFGLFSFSSLSHIHLF